MAQDPEFHDGVDSNPIGQVSEIVGVEYEDNNGFLNNIGETGLYDQDAPCAVCEVSRSTVMMVPSKRTCPQGWVFEYEGLLMADYKSHTGRGEYVCVSLGMETVEGGYASNNGGLWYIVEAVCGKSLPCPPYDTGFEISCVVCTK